MQNSTISSPDDVAVEQEDVDDDSVDLDYIPQNDEHHPIPSTSSGQREVEPLPKENYTNTRWRKKDSAAVPSKFPGMPFKPVNEMRPPISYFKDFFDDDLIQHITDQTNLYCTQQKLKKGLKNPHIQTDKAEIEQLLGILLYMGIYHNSIECVGVLKFLLPDKSFGRWCGQI